MRKSIRHLFLAASIATVAVTTLALTGCKQNDKDDHTAQTLSQKYTCPMHTEIVQDKPGKCPKCGMKLVEKK